MILIILLLFYVALFSSFPTSAWKIPQRLINSTGNYASGDKWSIKEQDDRVCKTDTRQFSGRVQITDDKNLFFCMLLSASEYSRLISIGFFESRKDPENRPVVIWLNG
jgi:carboxypeptidase C (cathepsin A)